MEPKELESQAAAPTSRSPGPLARNGWLRSSLAAPVRSAPLRQVLFGAALAALLHLTRLHSYLLFHSLAETFGVVCACGIFMIGWNARRFMASSYLVFLGIVYLFVGGLDLVHLLAYEGMGVFTHTLNADLAAQLWVAARTVEATGLLLAPFYLERPLRPALVLPGFALLAGGFLAAISLGAFPTCYAASSGLTRFKIVAEMVICVALGGAALLLRRRRDRFDPPIYRLVVASILVTIASEAAFMHYSSPYSLINELGHLLKIISFYLVYRATIVNGLREPYALLFRELKQSEEELRRANRELEGYAHTVSHDLKNPLAAVIGAGQALRRLLASPSPSAADLEAMAEIVVRSGRKAVDLVNDLLALAEAGQRPSRTELVSVAEVVTRVLEERDELIRERGAEVRVDPDLGQIRAAPAHIYQLFANLIGNSLRQNDGQGPVVEVRRLPGVAGEHRYLVRDNGPGIPSSALPHIFQPFFKGKTGGHGIGLSTVHRIVELYGGEIRVFNERGACFEIRLQDWQDD